MAARNGVIAVALIAVALAAVVIGILSWDRSKDQDPTDAGLFELLDTEMSNSERFQSATVLVTNPSDRVSDFGVDLQFSIANRWTTLTRPPQLFTLGVGEAQTYVGRVDLSPDFLLEDIGERYDIIIWLYLPGNPIPIDSRTWVDAGMVRE